MTISSLVSNWSHPNMIFKLLEEVLLSNFKYNLILIYLWNPCQTCNGSHRTFLIHFIHICFLFFFKNCMQNSNNIFRYSLLSYIYNTACRLASHELIDSNLINCTSDFYRFSIEISLYLAFLWSWQW